MQSKFRTFGRMLCASVVLALIAVGCAGPSKLAERSQEKLAGGDIWRAWQLADGAYEQALTRVAVLPFAYAGKDDGSGREIGAQWRDALADALAPPHARFTRVLGADAVAAKMTVAQLGRLSRDDAVRIGRQTRAQPGV